MSDRRDCRSCKFGFPPEVMDLSWKIPFRHFAPIARYCIQLDGLIDPIKISECPVVNEPLEVE